MKQNEIFALPVNETSKSFWLCWLKTCWWSTTYFMTIKFYEVPRASEIQLQNIFTKINFDALLHIGGGEQSVFFQLCGQPTVIYNAQYTNTLFFAFATEATSPALSCTSCIKCPIVVDSIIIRYD